MDVQKLGGLHFFITITAIVIANAVFEFLNYAPSREKIKQMFIDVLKKRH